MCITSTRETERGLLWHLFSGWGGLGVLGDGLMGSVYLWGFPGLLPLFLGGLPCNMVLLRRLVTCGGVLRSVGGSPRVLLGCIGFSWNVTCGSWAVLAGGWVLWCTFFLPVTTLIDYLISIQHKKWLHHTNSS